MKSAGLALAASLAAPALVAGAPRVVQVNPADLSNSVLGGSSFKIQQVHNKNFMQYGRGPRALAKVYQKYNMEMPAGLASALEQILQELGFTGAGSGISPGNGGQVNGGQVNGGQVNGGQGAGKASGNGTAGKGEVAATPQLNDVEFLAPVQIGTPPQTLNLDFDTGSSDLWVFSTETPARQQGGQKLYQIQQSSTAQRLQGHTWAISYGDGSRSSGNVFLDTVSIGGITVPQQAVESATRVSASFTRDAASSGLLGLAFDGINQVSPNKQKTFVTNALGSLTMPLFTANLKKGQPGTYNFGFIDTTEFVGPLSFVDVNKTAGFWQFQATGFSVGNNVSANGTSSSAFVPLAHEAIADTGTTLLMLPPAIAKAYYSQVAGAQLDAQAGGFVFPCSSALPDLALQIGTYKAVVPADLIKFAPVDSTSLATATTCFGGVQSANGLPFAIYGDIFLKAQFTVFNAAELKLGFAPKSGV